MSSLSKRRMLWGALAVIIVLLYLVPLGSYPLMEPDEGRYAEIPREMIESGNYITPMLNYVKYFEKPAFLYWLNAASFKLLGQNEFAARFGTALCALAGAGITAWLGAFIYGFAAGGVAGVVLATSLLYFAVGTINITDMALSMFLTLAFASFYIAQSTKEKKYYLLFYFAAAMAILTKGLVGIVLPGAVIFCYILATRKWKLFYKPLWLPGILLFFAVVTPWFWLVCRDNPDFFRFFFIQEHFLRYTTKMHNRYEPFWYFLPMIPAGLMPWTAFFFALFSKKSVVRTPINEKRKDAVKYLLLWSGVILLFFSLSDSKLIPYIAPCMPPLAILIGADIIRMAQRKEWHGWALQLLTVFGVVLGTGLLGYSLVGEEANITQTLPVALKMSLGLFGAPLLAWYFTRKKSANTTAVIFSLCLCAVFFIAGLLNVYNIVAPQRTMKYISQVIIKEGQKESTLAAYDDVLQGLSFYTGRRVLTVGKPGELEYGLSQPEARDWHITKEQFLKEWREKKKPFILVIKKGGRVEELFPKGITGAAKQFESGKYLILFNREDK